VKSELLALGWPALVMRYARPAHYNAVAGKTSGGRGEVCE